MLDQFASRMGSAPDEDQGTADTINWWAQRLKPLADRAYGAASGVIEPLVEALKARHAQSASYVDPEDEVVPQAPPPTTGYGPSDELKAIKVGADLSSLPYEDKLMWAGILRKKGFHVDMPVKPNDEDEAVPGPQFDTGNGINP
jgi:hypothetical protein